jgi:uncharacterized protein YbdZ (MbtH family)
MPVVVTTEFPTDSAEFDRVLTETVGRGLGPAPGSLFRAAGPIPGGWRIVTGWESLEAYETALRERMQPGWATLGIQPSRREIWHVESTWTRRPPTA